MYCKICKEDAHREYPLCVLCEIDYWLCCKCSKPIDLKNDIYYKTHLHRYHFEDEHVICNKCLSKELMLLIKWENWLDYIEGRGAK